VVMILLLGAPATAQETPTPPPTSDPPSPISEPPPAPPSTPTRPEPSQGGSLRSDRSPDRQRERQRRSAQRRRHRRQRQRERRRERRREPRIDRGCAAFSHTQTYMTWGPAVAYSEPVTVAYQGQRCTRGSGAAARVTVNGRALVYQGVLAQGDTIDRRRFTLFGQWEQPSNATGWPPKWWGCGVKRAGFRWEISGVYTFDVQARWGAWTLLVATQPAAPSGRATTFHWTYNGC